ncbi:molybdopterin molybdenumtransferase MoeA [Silvibacterium dinghuense]|uniref:Molybdopterin molybdenumtransferase n=2 Tax=Silvibacterium dinghuense TaxID=1560006 RepID=A0A4Q1SL00_9BACT|nr:molybdopterin molybdenumtransferase MoeA [Silvibacterium dinghuense]GGG96282.1 molybdopterin molybdenumtransferase MoeA [Silvibacterium dinghuense]
MEDVALGKAPGRVLAATLLADRDQPPFPRSVRDGYAARAAELDGRPLQVIGQIHAGESWTGATPAENEAIEIMTGAPLPEGLDCVAMIEHVREESGRITPEAGRRWRVGENVVPRGAEARAGAALVPAGTRLGTQHVAVAAICGYSQVKVYARPRVAILATGDELVGLSEMPGPFQIRNSNSYSLASQVERAGGEAMILPAAPDQLETIADSIREAAQYDMILLSGGVSMGRRDFVELALESLGAEFFFTGAKIQPGKPVVFGRIPVNQGWRYFFGLPGNPVSTMVTFALFGAPLLRALSGESENRWPPRFLTARLTAKAEGRPGLTRFLPSRSATTRHGLEVHPVPWQGSGDLAATATAGVFAVVPEEGLAAGAEVRVVEL